MRRYETICIIDPDISEDQRTPLFDRIKDSIAKENGLLVLQDEWGMRKLAYEIKKKHRGYYVRLDYCGTGDLVNEIERFFRIDDRVIKYMTVLLDDQADPEKVKEEMDKAEAARQAAQQAAVESEAATAPADEAKSDGETPAPSETEAAAPADEAKSDHAAKEPTEPEAAAAEPASESETAEPETSKEE
jgi:small subunit ribosomal protein S6